MQSCRVKFDLEWSKFHVLMVIVELQEVCESTTEIMFDLEINDPDSL
jgi:hypothetical protein